MPVSPAVPDRVLPTPDAVTEPYWAAAREGVLELQRCLECEQFTHPPSEWCRSCGSRNRSFARVTGTGAVETFSVVHRTFAPGFADRTPYVVACIGLDEQRGLRMFGNVLDVPPEEVRIGMRVEVVFEEIGGFGRLPGFRPVRKDGPCASE